MRRIKQITVNALFGIFDHTIPLNLDDHITIIHGPNGFGKTALLRMIDGLFNAHIAELRTIPFKDFRVDFDDGSALQVQKSAVPRKGKRQANGTSSKLWFFKAGVEEPQSWSLDNFEHLDRKQLSFFEDIPGLYRIGPTEWQYLPEGEILSSEEVFKRFGAILPIARYRSKDEPDWLRELRDSVPVRFIQTQRLLGMAMPRRRPNYDQEPAMTLAVTNYSNELARTIQAKLAEYATLSQALDRSFPNRLFTLDTSLTLSDAQISQRLQNLEAKRAVLMAVGLLDQGQDAQLPQHINQDTRRALSVYIDDIEKKLKVFDEIAAKIDLFKQIINRRFQYKTLSISKEKGFIFTTNDGNILEPSDLSSGEQHELVLLYEFLFRVQPGALIMLDEPELSLHVAWQVQFLEDLQEIIKIVNFDALIATHSPQIIHDRWDLTVELRGPTAEVRIAE